MLAAVIGSIVLAAPLLAQASEEELLQRIEMLRTDVQAAARAAAEAGERREREAAEARRALTTTFTVGPLRVMTLRDQAEDAAELFEAVWREDFHGIGESPSLERSVFAFDWWDGLRPTGIDVVAAADMRELVMRQVEVARRWAPSPTAMREHVRNAIWAALRDDFPRGSPMGAWSEGSRYLRHEDAYRSLATAGSGASRSCLAGDLEACAATLGLAPVEGPRIFQWLTPRQRRNVVMKTTLPWYAGTDRQDPDVVACLDRDETAACDAALARMDRLDGAVLTTPALPVSVLWYAVEVGGEGAWRRAIEDPAATPADVLERASGLDAEAVIAGWRAFMLDHRPAVHAGLGRSALTALFWILIFAGFAMRSTRWRFA